MTFTVGQTFKEAIDRLTTQAAAVIIAGLAVFGIIRTAAGQDIYTGIVEGILDSLETADFREDLGPNATEALESAEAELEASIAELSLALGLSPSIAAVLWLIAYVLGLAVIIVGLDTFGNEGDTFAEFETDNIGWNVLHLFLGSIVFGILVTVGLLLFVIPGLLFIVFLFFFPAAIALDNQSFFEAFSTSASIARNNFLSTVGLILLALVVFIALGIVGWIIGGAISGAPGEVFDELFSAFATALGLAIVARAYVGATR